MQFKTWRTEPTAINTCIPRMLQWVLCDPLLENRGYCLISRLHDKTKWREPFAVCSNPEQEVATFSLFAFCGSLSVKSVCKVLTVCYNACCKQHWNDWERIYTHNRHSISHPHKWALECLLWIFGENWLGDNEIALYKYVEEDDVLAVISFIAVTEYIMTNAWITIFAYIQSGSAFLTKYFSSNSIHFQLWIPIQICNLCWQMLIFQCFFFISVLSHEITSTFIIFFSPACSDLQRKNSIALLYWPFVSGLHQPIMQKAFPCHNFMMFTILSDWIQLFMCSWKDPLLCNYPDAAHPCVPCIDPRKSCPDAVWSLHQLMCGKCSVKDDQCQLAKRRGRGTI